MENRKLIYLFGLLFSVIFAFVYYGLFTTFIQLDESEAKATLYYNQVGLYKSEENAQKVIQTLKDQNIEAFVFPQKENNAVICSLSLTKEETAAQQKTLKDLNMNYIEKNIELNQQDIIDACTAKEFTKALEMITNEGKGNEQAGTPS